MKLEVKWGTQADNHTSRQADKQTIAQADNQTSRQRDVPHMGRNTQTWTDTDTVRNNTDTNKGRYVLIFKPTFPSMTSLVYR